MAWQDVRSFYEDYEEPEEWEPPAPRPPPTLRQRLDYRWARVRWVYLYPLLRELSPVRITGRVHSGWIWTRPSLLRAEPAWISGAPQYTVYWGRWGWTFVPPWARLKHDRAVRDYYIAEWEAFQPPNEQ